MKAEAPDEKALRSACQNALVIGVVVLSNLENERRQRAVLAITEAWEAWHSEQSHRLRSVEESMAWIQEQQAGAFVAVCIGTFKPLFDLDALRQVGLRVDFPASLEKALMQDQPRAFEDDEIVACMGRLALHLVMVRLRRNMYLLRGWPLMASSMIPSRLAETPLISLAALKADWENFQQLSKSPVASAKKLCSRSFFHLVCNQQLIGMFEQSGWIVTTKIEDTLKERSKRVLQTQLNEDGSRASPRNETCGRIASCEWQTLTIS